MAGKEKTLKNYPKMTFNFSKERKSLLLSRSLLSQCFVMR